MSPSRRAIPATLGAVVVSAAVVLLDHTLPNVELGYVHLVPLLLVQRHTGRLGALLFAVVVVTATFFVQRPEAALEARIAAAVMQMIIFVLTIEGFSIVQHRDASLREALHRQTTEREFRFLVEAGDALANLDEERIAARVAELAVPTLGDACVVYRPHGETIVAEAYAAIDDERRARLRELHLRYPYNSQRPAVRAVRDRAVIVAKVDEAFIASQSVDGENSRLLRAVGMRSLLCVPLAARDRVLGAMTLLTFDGRRLFDQTDVAFTELFARRAALAIENAELYQREHRVADEYQRASLPVALPYRESVKFSAVYEAGHREAQVGGDWYDAFELDDGRLVVSVGDVAGSGLSAAVTMAAVRQTIRGAAHILADPVAILDAADATVRALSGDRFATAFLAVLDPVDRSLEFAAAGHLTPFVRLPEGKVDRLRATGLPLGLRERDADGMSALVQVPPGTLLLFFTDGIVETTRDVLAGLAALRSALACSEIAEAEYPAVALRDALLPAGAHDDVAMLSITIRDAGVPHWRFASDDAKAAQWVKRSFVGALIGAGVAQEDAALAEIVLGELVGNVARHAPGEVEVYLDLSRRNPVLHVLDRGPGFVYTAMLQPTDVFAESGRGLYIASRLARGLSVTRRPGGGSHARAVLAAVARAAEEPPALRAPSVRRAAGTTLG